MDDPVQPGQLLADRFRIVRRIAHGGMGVVYEARDEKLQRRIALKCARPGHDRHLTPEVRLATEVSHPNICKIYEIHTAQTPQGPVEFFTMEFLEGPTLTQLLDQGPLPREQALSIARQLCAGLAEAHRHQIVHGDLKSANLILTKNPDGSLRAVITDFGLARSAFVAGTGGGSPGYMAPELHAGATTTVASDIYALGVILHELACGFRPHERAAMLAATVTQPASEREWERSSESDRRRRLAELAQAKVPPLGSRWDAILKTCLHSDPAKRYSSVDQITKALGPSLVRFRVLVLSGALALAAVAAIATYERSTAPAETVKLDVAEVQAAPALAAQTRQLGELAAREIGRLRSSKTIAFSVQRASAVQATHRLAADLSPKGERIALHAVIQDLRSGAAVTEWSAEYAPAQLRYAPVALAGVVSSAFHLPALTTYATIRADAAAAYEQGRSLLRDDKTIDQAIAALHSARALDPDSALPYAGLAEAQRRKYFLTDIQAWSEEATASLAQAELRNPDFAEVHLIAGLLEFDRNRREEAVVRMRRAIEFQPPNPDAFRRLGQIYQKNGQFPDALQAFTEALRLAPKDFRVYQDLGSLYNTQSNFAQATKALQNAVRLAPDRLGLRTLLAAGYQNEGRFQEAEAELRVVMAQGASPRTLYQLGHVLMYEGREQEAVPLLTQAAKTDADNKFVWLYLGLACQRSGQPGGARTALQRGLALAEHDLIQLARSGYDRALLAYFCAQTGQTARAAFEAAQALQLSPHNADTIWFAALVYERVGDRTAALKTLEAAALPLLEDLQRWPEASALCSDPRFSALLGSARAPH